MNEEAIFSEAVAKPADQRAKFLDQACLGDLALRKRVEHLLRAHANPDSFLNPPDQLPATVDRGPLPESPGQQVGPYKLMEEIAEGGMGVVFVARQSKPLRRQVALKVIKPGMDSKAVIARFEAERQALALMDHPNIARVLDAGTTAAGRPYFVMELVRGIPITDYCDQHKLTVRQRLELFVSICRAIQHAHQKGIIHRDIKPTNVLVTEIDGNPVPKVIDFGIAKALHGNLTDGTIYTSFHGIVGTTLYMSPEQAALSGVDVDTRSDVYSLGALLYELLTGATPFEEQRLCKVALDEVCRIIREEDPPKPSTRISTLGQTASGISSNRRTEPVALGKIVRGDLDWIVMKTLEKDRSRRYDTASSVADDIIRFLRDEAITARPPSTAYRFRKFARRNKAAFAGSTLVAFSLVVVMLVFFVQSRRLRALVERYHGEIIKNAIAAAVANDKAELDQVLADARQAKVPPSAIGTLEAFAAFFNGRETEAVEALNKVVRDDPRDVRAWALLFCACRYSGDLDGYSRAEAQLHELSNEDSTLDALDRLFVGFAQSETHVLIPQGVAKLRSVVRERPSWAIARAMLAQALAHLAFDTRDETTLKEAIQQLTIARALMPRNPFVTAVGLHVHSVGLVDAKEKHNDDAMHLEKAEQYADELQSNHPQYLFGRITRARYFAAIDRPADALKEWKAASEYGGGGLVTSNITCLQIRLGDAAYRQPDAQLSPWRGVLSGDRRAALELSEQLKPDSMLEQVWTKGYIRRLCGDVDGAMRVFERIDQLPVAKPRWLDNPLRLLAGKISPEELMEAIANRPDSRFWSAHTHFCVAMEYLVRGEREKTEAHLHACVLENSWADLHHAAVGFLNRLRQDDDWPASLKRR